MPVIYGDFGGNAALHRIARLLRPPAAVQVQVGQGIGRVARALRTLVRASGTKRNQRSLLEIVE